MSCVHMYDTYGHVVGSSQENIGFGWDIRIVQYSDEASRGESRSGEASAVTVSLYDYMHSKFQSHSYWQNLE